MTTAAPSTALATIQPAFTDPERLALGARLPGRGHAHRRPGGTWVSWAASWDKTLLGRLAWRGLRDFFPTVLASLTTAAAASREASP